MAYPLPNEAIHQTQPGASLHLLSLENRDCWGPPGPASSLRFHLAWYFCTYRIFHRGQSHNSYKAILWYFLLRHTCPCKSLRNIAWFWNLHQTLDYRATSLAKYYIFYTLVNSRYWEMLYWKWAWTNYLPLTCQYAWIEAKCCRRVQHYLKFQEWLNFLILNTSEPILCCLCLYTWARCLSLWPGTTWNKAYTQVIEASK